MPGSARAELFFISAMMILILIVCGVAVYFFFKTYAKEKRERQAETAARIAAETQERTEETAPSK